MCIFSITQPSGFWHNVLDILSVLCTIHWFFIFYSYWFKKKTQGSLWSKNKNEYGESERNRNCKEKHLRKKKTTEIPNPRAKGCNFFAKFLIVSHIARYKLCQQVESWIKYAISYVKTTKTIEKLQIYIFV